MLISNKICYPIEKCSFVELVNSIRPTNKHNIYLIIKRFTGGKKAAAEATKIVSENLPHSPKPPSSKNIFLSHNNNSSTQNSNIKDIPYASNKNTQANITNKFSPNTEKFENIQKTPIENNISSPNRFLELCNQNINYEIIALKIIPKKILKLMIA